jgi:DNA-binding CsgD family transcriptional regulator
MGEFTREDFERAAQSFRDAPFVEGAMVEGLDLLAKAAGGWSGVFMGVSPTLGRTFNWYSGVTPQQFAEFEAMGGAIPGINPRLGALIDQPMFSINGDNELVSEEDRARSPFYQELYRRHDTPFCVAARLPGPGDVKSMVGVLRSAAQGPADEADKQNMRLLLPHLEGALRVQQALEGHGALVATQSFEALSMAAFLCNAWGRVVGMTPAADRLVARGGPLRLTGGQLTALDAAANVGLQAALRAACSDPAHSTVQTRNTSLALTDTEGGARRVDIAPLPLEGSPMRLGARAVVAVSDTLPQPRTAELLRRTYGLTRAEAEVAIDVAEGWSAREIGDRRGVSASTVRVQIQAVLQKTGLRKTSALASLVVRLASV